MKVRLMVLAPLLLLVALFLFPANALAAVDLAMDSVSFVPAQPIANLTTKIVVKIRYTGSASLTNSLAVNNLAFAHADFLQIVSSETGPSVFPSPSQPLYSGDYFTYTIVGKFLNTGTKTLTLKIDGVNYLVESNEANNTIMPKVDILAVGDLIKLANDPAVYKIGNNGQKHLYVNSPTFWSYHTGSWSALKLNGTNVYIQTISQTAFDSIPVGKNMVVKSGSKLIKFQNSPKVYLVFGNAKLKNISEQSALSLFDANWRNNLVIIQNGFESSYTRADGDFLDSDNDGLSDEDEINIYSTNPNNSDSDSDGYKDGVEVLGGFNPNGAGKL